MTAARIPFPNRWPALPPGYIGISELAAKLGTDTRAVYAMLHQCLIPFECISRMECGKIGTSGQRRRPGEAPPLRYAFSVDAIDRWIKADKGPSHEA
jgi:hypothetical protein